MDFGIALPTAADSVARVLPVKAAAVKAAET